MSQPRIEELVALLEKGRGKTREILSALTPEQWQQVVYPEPVWRVRDLLAHFLSAEEELLALAQNVAAGGTGAPADFDFDAFNQEAVSRLADRSPQDLLLALDKARQRTIDWVRTLDESQLDRQGRHPALGEVTLETMIKAMYGHQLFHMRDWLSR